MPTKGLFGFGRLIESVLATQADAGPQYVVEAMDTEMGKDIHTAEVPISDYRLIVTRDPANVQAMLATQSVDWDVGEHRTDSWKPLFGVGVFTSRGEAWKHSRALVRPQFARDQINDLDLIERHVQQLFSAIDRSHQVSKEGWTPEFDLQPLFYNMALDITTELIYGYSAGSQDPNGRAELPVIPGYDTPDRQNIGMHMDAGKACVETRGALWKYRWLLPTKALNAHCAAVHKYSEWFVRLRLQRGDNYLSKIESESGDVSKKRYVLLDELAKVTQDPVELRSQTLNILTAGRDTTAALMGWIFYFLSRHKDVFDKLREQTLNSFGPYVASDASNIEFKELRDAIPYMTPVINETLRMAPVIPLNERVALRDTVLPRGGGYHGDEPIFVPKGRQVLIPTYAMTRRQDLWGRDVDVFRPERWEEDGGRKFGFEFIPFGGGARQCLGQQFARTKAAYVIVRFLQKYDKIECTQVPPDAPLRFHHTIENRSGSGVQGHKLLIAIPMNIPPSFLESVKTEFPNLEVVHHDIGSWGQTGVPYPDEEWKDVTILMTFGAFPKTPELAPKLQFVQLISAGANHILEQPIFKDTKVDFCTANGVHGPQISEWVILTYLSFLHSFPYYLDNQRQAKWDRGKHNVIEDSPGKTVGILGYGAIGRQTARVATAMGMTVHAYTLHPRPTPESRHDDSWAPAGLGDPEGTFPTKWFSGPSQEDLHTFLKSGLDLLVVATPLTDNTKSLIGAAEFEALASVGKGRTIVSNIARGPVVNTGELIQALDKGLIRGAALDVTDPEPLPDGHPLWSTKNVIITPHVSGASTRYNERALAILKVNLGRYSEGGRLVNKIKKKRGY
ncbi:oxidoreductase-like protein [Cercophora newfieldiana]|uniref:Oxidoreductase-like protein n=1 Tax=Cercophora newfieldiana TaxID=92897 RepID=A0AA40CK64_9PEZI|nr:oxidoreductase-like protein [Cercophora newfieldiana]